MTLSLAQLFLMLLCLTIASSSRAQEANSGSYEPFSISISASENPVKSGDLVRVRVRLTNTSDHEIRDPRVSSQGLNLAYEFDVRGPDGIAETEKTGDKCFGKLIQSVLDRSLQPGESTPAEENVLNKVFKMTEPGQYSIQVSRHTYEEGNDRTIKSNTITITVTSPIAAALALHPEGHPRPPQIIMLPLSPQPA